MIHAIIFGVGVFSGVGIGVVIDAAIQRRTTTVSVATNQYTTTVEGWRQHLKAAR